MFSLIVLASLLTQPTYLSVCTVFPGDIPEWAITNPYGVDDGWLYDRNTGKRWQPLWVPFNGVCS